LKKAGVGKFYHTSRHFPDPTEFDLITRKGVYPYSYMTSLSKFDETSLPPISDFHSDLTDSDICQEDYQHAQKVWEAFNIPDMKAYHDLYLKTDVLLLADVFEEFRNLSMSDYGLDPAHSLSLPMFSINACLKMTKVELDFLTMPDECLFIEAGIRGGVSVVTGRLSTANNPYLPEGMFKPEEESKYILYLDANNLYGWAMSQPLPTSGFRFMEEEEIETLDIAAIPEDGPIGYFFEVDLDYPPHLHDLHNDMPLAPESISITKDMLSASSIEIGEKFDNRFKPQQKLAPNLLPKSRYVVHYVALQFYLKHGLILTKIHRAMEFKQSTWLEKYISFNTNKRKQATDPFSKDYYKFLSNSVYGELYHL
jgi:hypothetical protein